MTPQRHEVGARLSDHDLQNMLERAPEEGARRALNDVGLCGKEPVLTIHDMRSLLECISFVRRAAVKIPVHVITTGALIAPDRIVTQLRGYGPNPWTDPAWHPFQPAFRGLRRAATRRLFLASSCSVPYEQCATR